MLIHVTLLSKSGIINFEHNLHEASVKGCWIFLSSVPCSKYSFCPVLCSEYIYTGLIGSLFGKGEGNSCHSVASVRVHTVKGIFSG